MSHTKSSSGKESVWDFPRPPRLEPCDQEIRIEFGGLAVVETNSSLRLLERSHPPVYYVPMCDVASGILLPGSQKTYCEWKGVAEFFDISAGGKTARDAAWGYPSPSEKYRQLIDHIAFYAQLMDACYVGGERVEPQVGGFYGGWITKNLEGPFKGGPGTIGW